MTHICFSLLDAACVFGATLARAVRLSVTALQRFDLLAPPSAPPLAPSPPASPSPSHTLPALPDTTIKISEWYTHKQTHGMIIYS